MRRVDVVLVKSPLPKSPLSRYVGTSIPLGLLILSSCLERAGYRTLVIDADVYGLTPRDIAQIVKHYAPIAVGISATTPSYPNMLEIARAVKDADPHVKIFVGGPHVTFTADETLRTSPEIDAVVRGEGEESVVEVVKRFESGADLKGVLGVSYRRGDRIIHNPPRPPIQDLDKIPLPDLTKVDLSRYKVLDKYITYPMETSRGCPIGCVFCASSRMFGRTYRFKSPSRVVDEIEYVVEKFKIRNIGTIDDVFTLARGRAIAIAREIRERGLDISFGVSARVDTIDRELLKELAAAGTTVIYYGAESGVQRVIDWYRKRITIRQVIKAVTLTKSLGIETVVSFIFGAPIEDERDMLTTIKFAKMLKPNYVQFAALTPYPGTELREYALKHGLIEVFDWSLYDAVHAVMRTHYVPRDKVQEMVLRAYLTFYLSPEYIFRTLKRRKEVVNQIMKYLKVTIKENPLSILRLVRWFL